MSVQKNWDLINKFTEHVIEPGKMEELDPDIASAITDLELNHLQLQEDMLYQRRHDGEHFLFQLVLPEELWPIVLTSLHEDIGHLGTERTLDLVRSCFFSGLAWQLIVDTKIKTCNHCVRCKALPEISAPLAC